MNKHDSIAPPAGRLRPGVLLFIIGVLSPAFVPLLLALDLPVEKTGPIVGLLLFGIPALMMFGVIAAVGKPGFDYFNAIASGGKRTSPSVVSVWRYRIGLALFILQAMVGWLDPVLSGRIPAFATYRVGIGALCDATLLISLFVLGGEFWDKVHALFVHDARVVPAGGKAGANEPGEPVKVGVRFYIGAAIFILALMAWGLIPLASSAGWSSGEVASLSGGIFIVNKLGILAAIAVMGKAGFNHLKGLFFKLLRKAGPPAHVSPGRYRLGLVMLLAVILINWLKPYLFGLNPGGFYRLLADMPVGLLLVTSVFVLGGDFWDKLRALFSYRAKIEFTGGSAERPNDQRP